MIRVFTSLFGGDGHRADETQLKNLTAFCLMFVDTQGERNLLMEVEEAQDRLTELKQQLLFKKSQVSDAKAELDHKSRSIQEINKYLNYCDDMSRNKQNWGTIILFMFIYIYKGVITMRLIIFKFLWV